MSKPVTCSYCHVHPGIVECRDGCGRSICFACVLTVPTGGQCKGCYQKFTSVHADNHLKELESKSWQESTSHYRYKAVVTYESSLAKK